MRTFGSGMRSRSKGMRSRLPPGLRTVVKSCGLVLVVVVMMGTQASCFTARYDQHHGARRDAALRKAGFYDVVLTDRISGLVVLHRGADAIEYAFLGKKHSYIITKGGAELVKIARDPVAKHVRIFQGVNPDTRLNLVGDKFGGHIVLTAYGLENADYPPDIMQGLGFVPYQRPGRLRGSEPYTNYHMTVPIAGYLGKPIQLAAADKLDHPVSIKFWRGGPAPKQHDDSVGHAAVVGLDIITAPVQVLGVLGAFTLWGVACSAGTC